MKIITIINEVINKSDLVVNVYKYKFAIKVNILFLYISLLNFLRNISNF